ncbi:hypothetical protein N9X24_02530 [Rickettsiales bacterium]|nr:hypothetical protein [Rickettsiales bacterium]
MLNKIDNKENNHQLKSLAGSIAHESRNSLAAIKGMSEIIRENLDEMNQYRGGPHWSDH